MNGRWWVLLGLCLCTLSAMAQTTNDEQVWSLADQDMQLGNWLGAEKVWTTLLATPDWPYPRARAEAELALATAERQLRDFAAAKTLLQEMMAKHPHDGYTLPILAQDTSLKLAQGQADAVGRAWTLLLDDLSRPADDANAFSAALAQQNIGADLIADAIGRYIAAHPGHPQLTSMLALQLRVLIDAGEREAARALVQQNADLFVGAPEEATVACWQADDWLVHGQAALAAARLAPLSAFFPQTPAVALAALRAARQAGNPTIAAVLTRRLLSGETSPTTEAVESAFWLFQLACAAKDAPAATQWVDLMNTAAPEHPTAAKMRRLLKDLAPATTP
jgi:hypothetical protein